MRIVLDTNVFVSALLVETSVPAQLITQWRRGRFDVLTADLQLEELMRVTRYPKISSRVKSSLAGRLINDLRELARVVDPLPPVEVSADPYDNYLLAIASGGEADYLVTGDKPHLLALKNFDGIKIVSVRDFITLTRMLP
jgi:putative PIN family toxin of toxin-antitoxin system